MKIHLAWIRVTATAAAATIAASAAISGQLALAQGMYAPYGGTQQVSSVAPYGMQPTQPPVYPSATQQPYTPVTQNRYAPTTQVPYARHQYQPYQPPQYQRPATRPTYTMLAQQPNGTVMPGTPSESAPQPENLPTPDGAMSGDAVQQSYNQVFNGGYSNGSNCNSSSPYPSTDGYQASDPGCANGSCGYQDYGMGGYMDDCGGTQWFGGIYGLYMTRDNPSFRRTTVQFDTPAGGYPYYPIADVTVLSVPHADHDYRGGFEIRFGSTIGTGGGCDTGCDQYGYGYGDGTNCDYGNCGYDCCAQPECAWEVGYWFLDDDVNTAQVVDSVPTDTNRMYGSKNFTGLQYDAGGGYRPVNNFYDYELPVTDPTAAGANDVRILAQRVRSNFKAQNVELNFLRLPVAGVSTCGVGYDQCDPCNGGAEACGPSCGSPFSVTALCGIRYIRFDDDFEYATMWGYDDDGTGSGPLDPASETFYTPWDLTGNELFYDVNVDNHLAGFQLGANMNYCVSCRCNTFWYTNFGLYNNHVESYQRVYGTLGPAVWTQSGEDATVRSDKDDVAFVGEMLIGGSYDFTCHWRGILAYRAIAVSGVALSVDQMPESFANEEQVALIDSDGSLIIHGVTTGVECRY